LFLCSYLKEGGVSVGLLPPGLSTILLAPQLSAGNDRTAERRDQVSLPFFFSFFSEDDVPGVRKMIEEYQSRAAAEVPGSSRASYLAPAGLRSNARLSLSLFPSSKLHSSRAITRPTILGDDISCAGGGWGRGGRAAGHSLPLPSGSAVVWQPTLTQRALIYSTAPEQ